MDTKRDQVREFVKRRTYAALTQCIASMPDREAAEKIRMNLGTLGHYVSFEIADTYPFLELADIMEWKRTRVRR